MRWLILSRTYFLSKLEFDSTTQVDKRTTFWCLTFDMKNQKNVEKIWSYHKCYIPLESSQWAKKDELHRKVNLKNVQSWKTNFYFTNIILKPIEFQLQNWWDSDLIPKFTKNFEFWKNSCTIVFRNKKSARIQNLSPYAHPRVEKSHSLSWNYKLGKVAFKIRIFKICWCHRNQCSKKQVLLKFHPKWSHFYSVFRLLKISFFEN